RARHARPRGARLAGGRHGTAPMGRPDTLDLCDPPVQRRPRRAHPGARRCRARSARPLRVRELSGRRVGRRLQQVRARDRGRPGPLPGWRETCLALGSVSPTTREEAVKTKVKRCAPVVAGVMAMAMAVSVAAAQRTFVSTNGDDLNPCSLAAPCRSFAKAMTQSAPGGEIVVQDSGGYGAVTVDRDVAINAPPGVYAGISVFPGQNGVDVVAPAANVVLRGLTINGQGGNIGLRVQSGNVHVENVVISGIGTGIQIEDGTLVRIAGTVVRNTSEA